MDVVVLDEVLTAILPPDLMGWIGELWPLFVAGILLGIVAWLISIVVYTALRLLDKMA